jgi:hypothetical protein
MNQMSAPPPTRGLVVVVVAVVVGALILAIGFDDFGTGGASIDTGSDAEEGTTETTIPPVTAVTQAEGGRPVGEVPVYVANGAGVSGLAGQITEQLRTAGYAAALEPGDATETAISQVYFLPDWEAEAQGVATALGLAVDRAIAMPEPVPFEGIPPEATVVVQVGTDLAPAAG